ncbi:MAG: methylcobamide--CoM methyltransferase [Treponema sp.]|jgi:[methyl-Co(III) methanol-specific corrinoid protein]:coenzyme M methyltransferase|nr:methylcobamide--CoM methyltransferase [Treponema sp.]
MDVFSPKERLLRVLRKEGTDRPPVICPGGMMNAAVVEVMEKNGHTLPAAHHEGGLMGDLAGDVYEQTGFENFGLPFCMTIEAEALGSVVDYGSLGCEPKISREAFSSVGELREEPPGIIQKNRRAEAVINAVHRLSKQYPDVPVIGSVSGPLSTAASIVDPMTFLKELRRDKEGAHRVLDYVTDRLIEYAKLIAENGAAVISIADPTATGEILGPRLFGEYALPCINRIADAVHVLGLPVIVHICGELRMVRDGLAALRGDALSVDAFVNLGALKREAGIETTMGNLSTYMLEFGNPEKISAAAGGLFKNDVDIFAPACGLSTSTPLANITAFTGAVKDTEAL